MLTARQVAAVALHRNTIKRIPTAELPFFRVSTRGDRRYRPDDVRRTSLGSQTRRRLMPDEVAGIPIRRSYYPSFYRAVHTAWDATAGDPCDGDPDRYEPDEHACWSMAAAIRVELHAAGIALSTDDQVESTAAGR